MASLLFGNCTMAGSKGWLKHVRLFGWLNYCVFKHSCHKYPWMNAQGLGEKRTQVNCSGLVFVMNTIWGLLWFTTGSLDLTSPLYPTFSTEESGESAVNITFFWVYHYVLLPVAYLWLLLMAAFGCCQKAVLWGSVLQNNKSHWFFWQHNSEMTTIWILIRAIFGPL